MTNTDEFDGEIHEVAIEDSETRPQPLAEVQTEAIEDDEHIERMLLLTRGRTERNDTSRLVEVQGTDDGQHTLLVLPDEYAAIGMYIHLLEQHGFEEEHIEEDLSEVVDISGYVAWRDGLSTDDRRERLLEQAEDRAHRSPHVERYLERGSFRTVDSEHETTRSIAQKLYDGIEPNPGRCYRNTILALNSVKEIDRIQYVEGMALPKQAGRPVAHAWLELDERVIELTWPWHAPIPPKEAVYYGVPLDTDDVLETTRRRQAGYNPILLTDEELIREGR